MFLFAVVMMALRAMPRHCSQGSGAALLGSHLTRRTRHNAWLHQLLILVATWIDPEAVFLLLLFFFFCPSARAPNSPVHHSCRKPAPWWVLLGILSAHITGNMSLCIPGLSRAATVSISMTTKGRLGPSPGSSPGGAWACLRPDLSTSPEFSLHCCLLLATLVG